MESILIQDYPDIQMICVDDGSIDNTKDVILSYKPQFSKKSWSLIYIYQPNSGQASAINTGLRVVNGEFIAWPDSDDYYSSPSSLSKLVQSLSNADSLTSIVRCLPIYLDNDSYRKLRWFFPYTLESDQFVNCLTGKNFQIASISYVARMSVFDKVIDNRTIVSSRLGQNYQILLPLLCGYKCLTIEEQLCIVCIHEDSHSQNKKSLSEKLYYYDQAYNLKLQILDFILKIPTSSLHKFQKKCKKAWLNDKLLLLINYRKAKEAKSMIIEILRKGHFPSFKRMIKCCLLGWPRIYNWMFQ